MNIDDARRRMMMLEDARRHIRTLSAHNGYQKEGIPSRNGYFFFLLGFLIKCVEIGYKLVVIIFFFIILNLLGYFYLL